MKTMIEHVALRVTDLDRSIAFYRAVMGFKPVCRRMVGDGAIEQVVFRVGEDVLVLFHSKGDIEKAGDKPSVVSENLQKKADQKWTGGMDHVAFSFDEPEYEAILRRVVENGYEIHRGPERNLGAFGIGYASYFYDPDHIEIEIKRYEDPPEQPGEDWFETGEIYGQ